LAIFNRLPKAAQIAALYALIVFTIYSWTVLWFFFKIPGWLYYLSIGEIFTSLAYSLATNFFESLVVLAIPVFLAVVLPKKWFYDLFVARGAALILPGLVYMMYVAFQFQSKLDYPSEILNWYPAVLALVIILAFLVGRVPFLCKALETLGDRATVFLYLSIPIGLVSILAVAIRMLV
jgi:hypothetical protein